MWDGLANFTVWQIIIFTLVVTHITIISVTVYLHRYSAHRALELHPALQHFFRFWLWLTTGMTTKAWTAIHRKHHAKCETPDDPHSPQVLGLKKVLWQGAELYQTEAKNADTLERYGKGTPDDWMEHNVYGRYDLLGIVIMAVIDLALFGLAGLTVWAVQMLWIPFLAAGVINGIGHYWGYRNFETADAARNIFPWGILIGGEELHNNHHTYGTSAKLSYHWWEFDMGWFYIKLFSLLGLAEVKKLAPKPLKQRTKWEIDSDTLSAVLANRFQVMAQYRKQVVSPVIEQEKAQLSPSAKSMLNRAKALICRNEALIDDYSKTYLDSVLNKNQTLNLIYQYRVKLQIIWDKTSNNNKDMRKALADWCKEAEQTGIRALEEFANTLRTYTMKTA